VEEPRVALAASPREWAGRLHRHVADHGGAVVRATVLHPRDALAEDFDVFVGDDCTSFLTRRLVEELHRRGRSILGVHDPDDPAGKGELIDLGVDQVIARGASPEEFVAAVRMLAGADRRPFASELAALVGDTSAGVVEGDPASSRRPPALRGQITVVAGTSGGVGTTEVAVGLAAAADRRRTSAACVDADVVAPSLAQRLGVPAYPNIRAAIDALEHRTAQIDDALLPCRDSGVLLMPGLSNPQSWAELRPAETVEVVRALTIGFGHVVVDAGHRVEDLHALGGPARYAVPRALLGTADVVVGVALPSPVGLARALMWFAQVRDLAPSAAIHLVVNRAPSTGFKQAELAEEVTRTAAPAGLWFLPTDEHVETAAWSGTVPRRGPFSKAIDDLASGVLSGLSVPRRQRVLGRAR
jgi:MinD-like ATPase involved in chromosome partitioning or flagellar assembly